MGKEFLVLFDNGEFEFFPSKEAAISFAKKELSEIGEEYTIYIVELVAKVHRKVLPPRYKTIVDFITK